MIRNVKTYKELLAEKERLKEQLHLQKNNIRHDFDGIKEEFKPVGKIFSVLHNVVTKDKTNPLLNVGVDVLIDVILRRVLLARAGWITKLAVPFFVKNYSSHVLADETPTIFEKISALFKKLRHRDRPSQGNVREETIQEPKPY